MLAPGIYYDGKNYSYNTIITMAIAFNQHLMANCTTTHVWIDDIGPKFSNKNHQQQEQITTFINSFDIQQNSSYFSSFLVDVF